MLDGVRFSKQAHLDVLNTDGRSVGVSGNAEKRDQLVGSPGVSRRASWTDLANISRSLPSDTGHDGTGQSQRPGLPRRTEGLTSLIEDELG